MEHVVQRQSNKLYTLKTATSRLERTLRYQNHLVQSQTIPKNYSPQKLPGNRLHTITEQI